MHCKSGGVYIPTYLQAQYQKPVRPTWHRGDRESDSMVLPSLKDLPPLLPQYRTDQKVRSQCYLLSVEGFNASNHDTTSLVDG